MISGYNYDLLDDGNYNYFGGTAGLIFLKLYTGKVPDFVATPLYSPLGGLPTGLIDIQDSELTVIPILSGFQRYYSDITVDTSIIRNMTGWNETAWVNGIKQKFDSDYTRNFQCTLVSGIVDPPDVPLAFFNSSVDTGFFNV